MASISSCEWWEFPCQCHHIFLVTKSPLFITPSNPSWFWKEVELDALPCCTQDSCNGWMSCWSCFNKWQSGRYRYEDYSWCSEAWPLSELDTVQYSRPQMIISLCEVWRFLDFPVHRRSMHAKFYCVSKSEANWVGTTKCVTIYRILVHPHWMQLFRLNSVTLSKMSLSLDLVVLETNFSAQYENRVWVEYMSSRWAYLDR